MLKSKKEFLEEKTMNFKKIIASVAAAALAVSAMAVNTFALTTETHRTDATLYVISEKPDQEKP